MYLRCSDGTAVAVIIYLTMTNTLKYLAKCSVMLLLCLFLCPQTNASISVLHWAIIEARTEC